MTQLPTYSDHRPCPKCGGGFVRTKFDLATGWLGRKCERCEYTWSEEPLDAHRDEADQ